MSSNLMKKSDDNEGVIKVANRIITNESLSAPLIVID